MSLAESSFQSLADEAEPLRAFARSAVPDIMSSQRTKKAAGVLSADRRTGQEFFSLVVANSRHSWLARVSMPGPLLRDCTGLLPGRRVDGSPINCSLPLSLQKHAPLLLFLSQEHAPALQRLAASDICSRCSLLFLPCFLLSALTGAAIGAEKKSPAEALRIDVFPLTQDLRSSSSLLEAGIGACLRTQEKEQQDCAD